MTPGMTGDPFENAMPSSSDGTSAVPITTGSPDTNMMNIEGTTAPTPASVPTPTPVSVPVGTTTIPVSTTTAVPPPPPPPPLPPPSLYNTNASAYGYAAPHFTNGYNTSLYSSPQYFGGTSLRSAFFANVNNGATTTPQGQVTNNNPTALLQEAIARFARVSALIDDVLRHVHMLFDASFGLAYAMGAVRAETRLWLAVKQGPVMMLSRLWRLVSSTWRLVGLFLLSPMAGKYSPVALVLRILGLVPHVENEWGAVGETSKNGEEEVSGEGEEEEEEERGTDVENRGSDEDDKDEAEGSDRSSRNRQDGHSWRQGADGQAFM